MRDLTLGNMRSLGVRSLGDVRAMPHEAILSADRGGDAVLVRTFRPRMVCTVYGIVGADARPELAGNEGERELADRGSLDPTLIFAC